MPRTLLCAIGLILWPAVVAGQAAPLALPPALAAHVKADRWHVVTSKFGLPIGVRVALQNLFGTGTLDIADPEEGSQDSRGRGLIAAGCSYEYCLVYYERRGATPTWRVALFRAVPADTRFEWGGLAPRGLKTIDEVRQAVLSGRITNANKTW